MLPASPCLKHKFAGTTLAIAAVSLLMMPNALMNVSAQPITEYLDVKVRDNDYNSLEKRIILSNGMLEPIKQVRLTLSPELANKFLLSEYAFKQVKWYEIVTIKKNGKYLGEEYTGYIIVAASNTEEPAKLIVHVGKEGYTIEVPKWTPPHGTVELQIIKKTSLEKVRSDMKNAFQKVEFDRAFDDWKNGRDFGNSIRADLFDLVVIYERNSRL